MERNDDHLSMTTKEAFEKLISERAWYKDLGFERTTAGAVVSRFKNGTLSIEKMEDLLLKTGFKVKQEKLWEK
jgi:hypothetical protein